MTENQQKPTLTYSGRSIPAPKKPESKNPAFGIGMQKAKGKAIDPSAIYSDFRKAIENMAEKPVVGYSLSVGYYHADESYSGAFIPWIKQGWENHQMAGPTCNVVCYGFIQAFTQMIAVKYGISYDEMIADWDMFLKGISLPVSTLIREKK